MKIRSIFKFDDIVYDNDWKWVYIGDERTNYQIHKNGTVTTVNFNNTNKPGNIRIQTNQYGYCYILVHWKGESYRAAIHRLVASAFIPEIKNKPYVNHIDGNKCNNDVYNLEWVTPKENTHHAIETGLIKVGDKSVCTKYNEKIVRKICNEFVKNKLSPIEIARKYDVSYELVNRLKDHKSWHHITKEYDYDHYDKRSHYTAYGEDNSRTNLTNKDVEEICQLISDGVWTLKGIAAKYNVTYKTIQHIYNRTSWSQISNKYDFSNYVKSNERK